MLSLLARVVLVAAALMVAQMVAGGVTFALFGPEAIPGSGAPPPVPWQAGSALVSVAFLGWVAWRTDWRGWRLAGALAALLFAIQTFNSLIEALFFGFFPAQQFFVLLFMTFLTVLLFSPALLLLKSGERAAGERTAGWRPRVTAARFAAGALAYLIVYFIAGMLIFPFIAEFYEELGTPSGPAVIAMQLLVRGPIFVAAAILLVRMSRAGRCETIFMVGAAFSVLGGIAPLMVPNALFPDAVRYAHFVEVVLSNFVFGAFLGWLLTGPRVPMEAEQSKRQIAAGTA